MGLGFKAPLAYTSSFYFVCRKDGTERKYMMYEGEEGNSIDSIYESPTSEPNGVKVIIPVKYSDRSDFFNKIKKQLAYFENVYFDVSGIDNAFTIFRHEEYQVSSLATTKELHLCLDNVYYPIDFSKLGISSINVPVGLRFSLTDGIFPTPNREAIRYTQEAKTKILEKLHKVATILLQEYNSTINEVEDIETIFNYYSNSSKTLNICEKSLEISPLLKYSEEKLRIPTLKGVSLLDLKELSYSKNLLLKEFTNQYTINKNRKLSETKSAHKNDKVSIDSFPSYHMYVYSERISGIKKEYLKSQCSYCKGAILLKKTREYSLGYKTRGSYMTEQEYTYYNALKLKTYPRKDWRQVIKEFQSIQEHYISKLINIDTLEIPQQWIDDRKKQRIYSGSSVGRRTRMEGDLFCKVAVKLERNVDGQNCKFIPETLQYGNLYKYPGLIVYDVYDNSRKLDKLYYIKKDTVSKMNVISVSNREFNTLNKIDIHNLMSLDKFMEGNNKPFKRLVTAHLIDELIDDFVYTFRRKQLFDTISSSLNVSSDTSSGS